MKKFISIFAFLFLLIHVSVTVCLAEEPFTLHSDVEFGMTLEEVTEKEKENGFTLTTSDFMFTGRPLVEGTVAGIDNSIIFYTFENDKLYHCLYSFRGMTSPTDTDQVDDYITIGKSLRDKYGEPNYTRNGGNGIFDKGYHDNYNVSALSYCYYAGGTIIDYAQWLIEQEDGTFVFIDHSLSSSSSHLSHDLSYLSVKGDEIDEYLTDRNEERNKDL